MQNTQNKQEMEEINHSVIGACVDFIDGILDDGVELTDIKNGEVIHIETIKIDEHYQLDHKLVNGDSPYVDTVLFYDGNEVWVDEPGDEYFTSIDVPYVNKRINIQRGGVDPVDRVVNNEDNRNKLADEVVGMWDLDTLIDFAISRLEQDYYENDDVFRKVLEEDIDLDCLEDIFYMVGNKQNTNKYNT